MKLKTSIVIAATLVLTSGVRVSTATEDFSGATNQQAVEQSELSTTVYGAKKWWCRWKPWYC